MLGLTFKANTDDMRDSPALSIIATLLKAGIRVHASDPQGLDHARELVGDARLFGDPYQAIDGTDAVIIATEWPEYRALDLALVRSLMRGRLFVDLRNVFSVEELDGAGFAHFGIGRPARDSLGDDRPTSQTSIFALSEDLFTPIEGKIEEAVDE